MPVAIGTTAMGTGTTPVALTFGFDPTLAGCLLVLKWSGRATNGIARANVQGGYGLAAYGSGQYAVCISSKDTGTSACRSGIRDDACVWTIDTAGADDGYASITWTSTGCTLTPGDAWAGNLIVDWEAKSGASVVGLTAAEPGTATTSVTTTGIRAKFGIILAMGNVSSYTTGRQVANDCNLSIGAFCKNQAGTIKNGIQAGASNDGVATTATRTYLRSTGDCLARFDASAGATLLARAGCTAIGAVDFTLTYSTVEGAGTHNFVYGVCADGRYEISSFTEPANTSTDLTITPGFRALGSMWFGTGNTAENAAGTASNSARFYAGFATDTSHQYASGTRDTTGQAGGTCTTGADNASCIYVTTNGSVTEAGHLTAVGATTMTARMTATGGAQNVGWVVSIADDANDAIFFGMGA